MAEARALCLLFRWSGLIHAVEVSFESIQVLGPEPSKWSQPGIQRLKRFWPQSVETPLRVYRGFHKTGLAQHSQVL